MVEWLAVVAFCVGDQCAFWAGNDKLLKTEAECHQVLQQAELYFRQQGAGPVLSGCVPLRYVKV